MTVAVYQLFELNKPFNPKYTGHSKNPRKRFASHRSRTKTHNCPVYGWMRKVGFDNVGMRVIENCKDKKSAQELEALLIQSQTHVSVGGTNKHKK